MKNSTFLLTCLIIAGTSEAIISAQSRNAKATTRKSSSPRKQKNNTVSSSSTSPKKILFVLGCVGGGFVIVFWLGSKYMKEKEAANKTKERTFAFIKPDALNEADAIKKIIVDEGFTIVKSRQSNLKEEMAKLFYIEHKGKPFFDELIDYMTSGPVIALMLERNDAIKKWQELMGPADSKKAKQTAPDSIRAKFGTDITKNAVHGSDSTIAAERELGFFFDNE